MTKRSVLRVDIGVALKVVPGPTLKAFSGTGVKRRREEWATREVARHISQRISIMHKFHVDDVRVDEKDVAELIFDIITAVPDDVANAVTRGSFDDKEAAFDHVTCVIENALTSKWQHRREPGTWDGGFSSMQKGQVENAVEEPTKYQPKYTWKRTQIDANDPPTDYDWIGYDGVGAVGRIRKEMNGPTKGKWQWAGWYPRDFKGSPPTPNTGWADTARIATQMCEEYWDRCKVQKPD
jgi:hypothetical protein